MTPHQFAVTLSIALAGIPCGSATAADPQRKPPEAGPTTKTSRRGDKEELKAIRSWSGVFRNEADQALSRKAPAEGFLSTDQEWAALWKAWRGSEPVPAIDFGKEIVLVKTSDGPNQMGVRAFLDKQGNLTTESVQTLMAGPGFGYTILSLARQGIKTIDGRPLKQ